MNPVDRLMLKNFQAKFGKMTSNQALELALDSEKFRKDIGPFDPAASHFIEQQLNYERYALLLEKAGE